MEDVVRQFSGDEVKLQYVCVLCVHVLCAFNYTNLRTLLFERHVPWVVHEL